MSAKVNFPKVQKFNTQTIDMASAQVALTWLAPGSGQVRISAPILLVDANSNGTEDLLLPIEAESEGVTLQIVNTGGESIVVKEDSDTTTIATLATGATGWFLCTGTEWKVVSPETTDFGSSGIAADVIAESTAAAGVTADGVLLKDGGITLADGAAILADVVSEKTAAAGVTIDGLLIKDERIQVTGAGISTGDAGVTLKDNLANAWDFKESTNNYLSFTTTNDAERVTLGKLLALPTQTVDMADAQVALVYGTAGAGEVKLIGQALFVDANSGATEDLLLPPEATSTGVFLLIANTGGESIVVKEDSDTTTIGTVATAKSAAFFCDGTTWFCLLGA